MASYVLTGRFNTNLGVVAIRYPELITAIMNFRDSRSGVTLRKEVLEQLSLRLGADFVTSVNAGLKATLPTNILQEAQDQFSGLHVAEGAVSTLTPALWNNFSYAEKSLSLWRKKIAKELKDYCELHHIGQYDQCPCGSGEKLRFCCEEGLKQ